MLFGASFSGISMDEFLQVGIITQTHGVRGEVKVFPTTDDAGRFKKLKTVYWENGKERRALSVQSVKFFKQFVIMKFKEFNTLDEVQFLKTKALLVDREHAVKLEKDEYFIADLIGMSVISDDDQFHGTVKEVLQTGANDVYVVELTDQGEVLLPAIKQCIKEIDMTERKIIFHMMEGLL